MAGPLLHGLGTPTVSRAPRSGPLRSGMVFSIVLHLCLVAALVIWGGSTDLRRPPAYRVELIAAPPGPRQAGVVDAASKPVAAKPEVAGAERPAPTEKALPTTSKPAVKSPKATPSTQRTREAGATSAPATAKATAAPKAGAGAQGGKGADVANISTRGIEFPYPGYLSNITRKIALNWTPRRTSSALVAEVKFMIRRDGSVAGIEVVRGSGDALYNADATGAIEAVGATRGFGALPSGFPDDVLVVYFTFDYALRP